MRTYRYYNTLIEKYDPRFFMSMDMVRISKSDYFAATTLGPISVMPIEGKALFYFGTLIKKSRYIGLMLLINAVNLSSDLDLTPESEKYSKVGWNSGNTILAVRTVFDEDLALTVGTQLNISPYVIKDSVNNRIFSVYYDEELEIYKGTQSSTQLFLHLDYSGFDFGTVYNFKKNVMNLFELVKFYTIGNSLGRLGTGFNFYDFHKTYQVGVQYKDFPVVSNTLFSMETYWNLLKQHRWNDISYLLFEASTDFLKQNSAGSDASNKKDFHIALDLGVSYSKDIFRDGLFGYCGELIFKNIRVVSQGIPFYMNFSIGVSNDYHKSLNRLPMKNEPMINFGFQLMNYKNL